MRSPLSVVLLLGTPRQGRRSEQVAQFVQKEIEDRSDMNVSFFDVRDFQLPSDHYGRAVKEQFPEYRDAVIAADGMIIVTPEYNHGYPGTLKSVLDLLLKEYNHKAVGIVGVASGSWGGTRVIQALLPVMRELGLVTINRDLHFPNVRDSFTEDGIPSNYEKDKERAKKFLDEFAWLAYALREARSLSDKD